MSDERTSAGDGFAQLYAALQRRDPLPTLEEMHGIFVALLQEAGLPPEVLPLEILQFRRALTEETDRGAALFAAAYIDARLEELLRCFLVQAPDTANALLKGDGGLAAFSARIDIAFLLGLITKPAHRDLHLIRKIRNDFAHNAKPIQFSHEPIASRCRELTYAPLAEKADTRWRYIQSAMGLAGSINGTIHAIREGKLTSLTEKTSTLSTEPAEARAELGAVAAYLAANVDLNAPDKNDDKPEGGDQGPSQQ